MALNPSKARAVGRERGGFPLASLALAVAALAMLLASADIDRWREEYTRLTADGPWNVYLMIGAAGVAGGTIGLVYVLTHGFRWRRLFVAFASGIAAGMIGLLLLLAPRPIWQSLLAAGVFLVVIVFFRLGAE